MSKAPFTIRVPYSPAQNVILFLLKGKVPNRSPFFPSVKGLGTRNTGFSRLCGIKYELSSLG